MAEAEKAFMLAENRRLASWKNTGTKRSHSHQRKKAHLVFVQVSNPATTSDCLNKTNMTTETKHGIKITAFLIAFGIAGLILLYMGSFYNSVVAKKVIETTVDGEGYDK